MFTSLQRQSNVLRWQLSPLIITCTSEKKKICEWCYLLLHVLLKKKYVKQFAVAIATANYYVYLKKIFVKQFAAAIATTKSWKFYDGNCHH